MSATVLVTGATGTLGPAAVAGLLRRGGSVVVLLRGRGESPTRRFDALERAVTAADPDAPVDGLAFVPGDLSRHGAGLAGRDTDRLAREVTHVLHLAADTRFSLPLARARAGNLDTTLTLLRLAERFARLEAIGVASTLYVAGTRTGTIPEDDLAETAFVNTYERAKFEAERALRARMRDLPIAVYRVATLLGSARTGEVRKPTAIHRALRLYHRGLVPMIPGDPDQPVELLDTEHAAEAMATLLLGAFHPGTTYHLTAGPERTFTLARMLDETHRALGELDPEWARRGIERPAVVPARTHALFERTVREAGDPGMIRILRGLSTFLPQLLHPKRFDRANTETALPGWDPPPTEGYYPLVLAYCLRTLWARGAAEAAATR